VIAPAAVSADALTDACGLASGRLTEIHRQVTDLLLAHGQLVFADVAAEAYFREQVERLGKVSPSAHKLWEGLLQFGRIAHTEPGTRPVEQIDTLADLVHDWAGVIDTALMEPERAQLLGCPEGDGSWRDPATGLEITCHDCAGASQVLSTLRQLESRRAIRKGAGRDHLWNERLGPLARVSDCVHIQDRYMGANLDKLYEGRRRKAGRGRCRASASSTPNEVEWLLDRLADEGAALTVSFYTQWPGSWATRDPIVRAFEEAVKAAALAGRGVSKVHLFIVDESRWEPHDRHFRGEGAGIELSAGFDLLRDDKVSKGFTMTYLYGDDVQKLKDEENEVRRRLDGPLVLFESA
jgi:hypothetical protein